MGGCCGAPKQEAGRGGADLKKLDVDTHKPTAYYQKNFKGTKKDRDYFYNREKTLTEQQDIAKIDDFIISSDDNTDEERATFALKKVNSTSFQRKGELGSMTREAVGTRYRFEKPLGEGAFGKVKVASLIADSTKKFAIKSIPRDLFAKRVPDGQEKEDDEQEQEEMMIDLLESEIQVVMGMDHPNIVKFYQCVYDNDYLNIVMELVRGKPLSDYLDEKKQIPENECQIIIRQMMHAISYLHSKGIVHRDLKLDNVMVDGLETGDINKIRVKLIDFGMSKFTRHGDKKINLTTYAGTLDFMAPEILEAQDYDLTCDIWSMGIITYFLLAGFPPFMGKDEVELVRKIVSSNYTFDDYIWNEFSPDAQTFVQRMLKYKPQQRMKPEVCIEHSWLGGPGSAKIAYPVHPHVMMNIGQSSNANELHYEMLILFTQFLEDRDIMDIRETFLSMDDDNTGTIEIDELKQAFNKIKKEYDDDKIKSETSDGHENVKSGQEWSFLENLTHDRLEQILHNVDQDESGSIEFVEFLTHSLTEKHLCDNNIRVFFEVMLPFDINTMNNESTKSNLNKITSQAQPECKEMNNEDDQAAKMNEPTLNARAIHKYFKKCGKEIKRRQLKKLMTEAGEQLQLEGFSGKSQINYEMFKQFLTKILEKQ